uniref:Lipid binding protein n=1 Tax=Solanum tuberosum TaxID=4113 RepID=M1BKX4_SOLTU
MSKVVHEGWMVRYGRRKIGKSFLHMRYFVLETKLLAYFKTKPQGNVSPIKTLEIDGNFRVEDRGLKTHHGQMVYVLSVYNMKEKHDQITMAAFNIQEALIWKEKIESVIDQHQESVGGSRTKFNDFKSGTESTGRTTSDQESPFSAAEDEDESQQNVLRGTTIANAIAPPESVVDWTKESESDLANPKYRRLLYCQNGLRIFEELLNVDLLPKGCSRAMKAVGVVEATCEEIFELVMSMDATRFEWDCSFQYGSLVEEVDGHTAILYHRLRLDWFPSFIWPRDLCYVRYWRRNDDGSYGLREYFSQTDERAAAPRIPVMVNMNPPSISSKKSQKQSHHRTPSLDQIRAANRNAVSMLDEYSDEDEDFQCTDQEVSSPGLENDTIKTALEEEPIEHIDMSTFSGNLRHDDSDNGRDCWTISDGNNFRVRGKNFCSDKTKVSAGKSLMDLVAVDWFKDTKRMDHVARHPGCAAQVASEKGLFTLVINLQVPGSTHYSMIFYFVMKKLIPGSLLQRFVDGDDEFRNSRMKLIPSVPKGSWIVRQSVGSSPCLLGKAVDCNYIRGPKYLEIDVDVGSSTVANGVMGLVIGVITSLVVDMAFVVQGNTPDELPEPLIGAARVCHIELSSAVVPKLEPEPSTTE